SVELFGVPFTSWRGVPLVPCDKLSSDGGKGKGDGGGDSSILLLRTGEEHQGVVGLHQAGIGTEGLQSLCIRKMGIDQRGGESYLLTCYFGVAVLTDDALAVLEKVKA